MVERTNQNPREATNLEGEVIFSSDRNWWETILRPRNWRGKPFVGYRPSGPYVAVDQIDKFREKEINQRIAEHLDKGDAIVFGGRGERLILIGDRKTAVVLDTITARNLRTGRINSASGIKGHLEADVSVGPSISFFNVRVGETNLTVPFNLETALDTPTIYAVSNHNSKSNHEAVLLFDHYRGTKKLVIS